jgi:phage terminase large subunit-like protein
MTDAAANIKPAKDKSMERIDPITALVMAIGRAMVQDHGSTSYYNDHDLRVI